MPTKCNKPHKCLRRRFCAEFLCGLFYINFVGMAYLDELENIQLVSDTCTYPRRCSPVKRHENIRQEHPLRNSKFLFNSFPVVGERHKDRGPQYPVKGIYGSPFCLYHLFLFLTGEVEVIHCAPTLSCTFYIHTNGYVTGFFYCDVFNCWVLPNNPAR